MEELKPCPFCGGEPYYYAPGPASHHIQCSNCYSETYGQLTKEKAARLWNTRHEQTCENVGIEPIDFECGECHFAVSVDPSHGVNWQTNFWKYCPDCGARVEV